MLGSGRPSAGHRSPHSAPRASVLHCFSKKPVRSPSSLQGPPAMALCSAAVPHLAPYRATSCAHAAPPSTSPRPSRKGRQGRPAPTPPSTSRRREEGEACATTFSPYRPWPSVTLCFQCFRRFQICCQPIFQVF
jgi:hypothetical protein